VLPRASGSRFELNDTGKIVVCRPLQFFGKSKVELVVSGIIWGSVGVSLKSSLSFVHLTFGSFDLFNRGHFEKQLYAIVFARPRRLRSSSPSLCNETSSWSAQVYSPH
jgi:hypothetical protein